MISSNRTRFIFLATSAYAVLALAWIFLSDQLLSLFGDIESILWLSTAKGVFFVVVTAALFFLALRNVPEKHEKEAHRLLESLAGESRSEQLPVWAIYAFTIVITLVTLVLNNRLAVGLGDRPMLILFVLPIILSAMLGGLGPGLLSTAGVGLGAIYLILPLGSGLYTASASDALQWIFLIANGAAVSLLSEMLRRSKIRVESNQRMLDAVIAGTPDAVFIKDVQGRYLLANESTASFVGKKLDEILGRDDFALFPEATARELIAKDRSIMNAGRPQTHEEVVTTFDGTGLVFLVTKGPVFDEAGQVIGLFGISREITRRKQAEEKIQRLNAELEDRIGERTAELHAAHVELEELAYALTHNLRSPLRAIIGFSQLLVDEQGSKFSVEAKSHVEQILLAGRNMGELVDGVLVLMRCSRGELHRETIDISALAAQHLDELARSEPLREVDRIIEPGLVVMGEAAMIRIVVNHLLDNAWKFTRNTAHATIRVAPVEIDGQPGIGVSDNGAGFDMAHAQRLFLPFQRLHRQDEFSGLGIGLATVQRIIQRHGGLIRAEGVLGAGATFCFSLPLTSTSSDSEHG